MLDRNNCNAFVAWLGVVGAAVGVTVLVYATLRMLLPLAIGVFDALGI
jgi:hypothetical protein